MLPLRSAQAAGCVHRHVLAQRTPLHLPACTPVSSPVACSAKAPRSGGGASSRSRRSQGASRGFGPQPSTLEQKREQTDQLVQEIEAEQGGGGGPGEDAIQPRSEYQLYKDTEYNPPRYIGPVEARQIPGRGRGLVVTQDIVPGELLMVLPALAFLEREMGEVPEVEELHLAMLEDGLTPAQRRVLDVLYDGSEASMSTPASLTTLDSKFWSSRGKSDTQAPQISSSRLLSILENCAVADGQQDAACMTMRHQKPLSYIGLWPELSLVNHSSTPNISTVVIKDRMLVHAASEMSAGDELVRSYLGAAITRPLPQREAALAEAGWPGLEAGTARGQLESQVSENVREVLQDAWQWFSQEALPRFSEANEAETLGPLKELLEEAEQIVAEVEEAVEKEPGLTDLQKIMLRASAYDSYDMLVLTDEFVNQERASPSHLLYCLELLRVLAPGSESHTCVALKYESLMRDRMQMSEALYKKSHASQRPQAGKLMQACARESDSANEYCLDAYLTRYGWVGVDTYESLRQATEVYTDALEQMSIMESEGVRETSRDFSINGVNVSVVDKVDIGSPDEDESSASRAYSQDGAGSSGASRGGERGSVKVMEAVSQPQSEQRGEVIEAEVKDLHQQQSSSSAAEYGWSEGSSSADDQGSDGGSDGGGDD